MTKQQARRIYFAGAGIDPDSRQPHESLDRMKHDARFEEWWKHMHPRRRPQQRDASAKRFCPLSVPFGDGTQVCACHGVSTASPSRQSRVKTAR